MKITDTIKYVGVNDHQVDLFEGQYAVPNGMAYNSYVILDDKVAVMDTVDANFKHEWLDNLEQALGGRKPDYLIVQHMEPDHAANVANFLEVYPGTTVVANAKTFVMIKNFFGLDLEGQKLEVENGSTLSLGNHNLTFVFAPMVHWPEVMVTYDSTDKVLFSADGFGKFGALDVEEDWDDEARRYFIGIVGKYGAQVQRLLKVAATLDIQIICPLHGPVDDLKKVAEDITKRSKDLGFSAFTSAGMDGSSDWRFKTHLANLPIYYEYQGDGIENTDAIKGTYLDNYRNIWNLYINNSTTSSKQLSTKTGDDAVAEFVTEKAVFYQNGTWAYSDIADLGDDNLGMLPIYIGADGEENQGLCTGTENYWCVNKKASKEDIQATLDFMNWCVTDDTAVKCMCGAAGAMPSGQDGMGFVIPFKKNLTSDNPLVNIANDYVKQGKKPVTWNFTTMPSEKWKNDLGSALTTYASKQTDANWDLVKKAFVDGWKKEAAAAKK